MGHTLIQRRVLQTQLVSLPISFSTQAPVFTALHFFLDVSHFSTYSLLFSTACIRLFRLCGSGRLAASAVRFSSLLYARRRRRRTLYNNLYIIQKKTNSNTTATTSIISSVSLSRSV